MSLVAGITERRLVKLILQSSHKVESLSLPGSVALDMADVRLANEGLMKLSTFMCNVHQFFLEVVGINVRIGADTILHPMHEGNQVL
jgi:hypothetical protein